MEEKHKIYIFSVLSHAAVGAVVYTLSSQFKLGNIDLADYLIWCSVGVVALPFIKLYEPTYHYLFKTDKDREEKG